MGGGPAKDHLLLLLPFPEPKRLLDNLRNKFHDIDITYHQVSFSPQGPTKPADLPKDLWRNTTILCTLFTFPDTVDDVPNLKLVHLFSAGSNQIQKHPLYTSSNVTITTSSGIHGPQIAEWVILTGLVQSHKYNQLYELQKQHKWGHVEGVVDDYHQVRDMVGRRLGVLGYGSIGRQVGRVAKAMGMDVVAYTATPKDTAEKRKDSGFIVPGTGDPDGTIPSEWYSGLDKANLHHFLKQDIDWLLVSVPLTKQTRHFLSDEEFRVLSQDGKTPAFVTNIARGSILDQPALVRALKDRVLAGAALDVTDPEPLPEDSELWDLPNVTVTPHVSGTGSSYAERSLTVLEMNIERLRKGEELVNVVRRKRGY